MPHGKTRSPGKSAYKFYNSDEPYNFPKHKTIYTTYASVPCGDNIRYISGFECMGWLSEYLEKLGYSGFTIQCNEIASFILPSIVQHCESAIIYTLKLYFYNNEQEVLFRLKFAMDTIHSDFHEWYFKNKISIILEESHEK